MHSVDWLTEALRRFSHAHLMSRGWSTVDMSVSVRIEKVTLIHSLALMHFDQDYTLFLYPL
jgi:hypothetical protein